MATKLCLNTSLKFSHIPVHRAWKPVIQHRSPVCYKVAIAIHRNIATSLSNPLVSANISSRVTYTNIRKYRPVFIPQRYAGHSKWQNIRHIKASKDMIKQKNSNAVLQKIRAAVIEGGGNTDPKKNNRLASTLEEGKKKDVPNATMTEYLKRLEKSQDIGQVHHLECKIPTGNVLLIFEVMTEHIKKTKAHISNIVKRYGGTVSDKKGFASYGYDHIGVVIVEQTEIPDLESAEDIAIESEAEDVSEIDSEDGAKVYQFVCSPETLNKVTGKIRKHDVKVKESFEQYIPHTMAIVPPEFQAELGKLFDKLDYVEEIQKIYDNIQVEET